MIKIALFQPDIAGNVGTIIRTCVCFNAELHIMNVDYHNSITDAAKVNESYIINELFRDVNAEFHSIEANEITEGINWFVDKSKLDWLVVIPKKHRLVKKIFDRSQTKELVYHTHVPILYIHE